MEQNPGFSHWGLCHILNGCTFKSLRDYALFFRAFLSSIINTEVQIYFDHDFELASFTIVEGLHPQKRKKHHDERFLHLRSFVHD